jgi:hypothetical protein
VSKDFIWRQVSPDLIFVWTDLKLIVVLTVYFACQLIQCTFEQQRIGELIQDFYGPILEVQHKRNFGATLLIWISAPKNLRKRDIRSLRAYLLITTGAMQR